MDAKEQARVDEIRQRLDEYHKHDNDPYAYSPDEIEAIRELKAHAPEDLAFLLALKCPSIQVKVESESGTSRKPATVRIYNNDELVAHVQAQLKPLTGADGGFYDCIQLTLEPADS